MKEIENLKQIVKTTQSDFEKLAKLHGAVNYLEEASFAIQLLTDNDYLASVARGNPDSLKRAVLNIAIIGLSLNPYKKEAYLVPRKVNGKMKVCLDISYQGEINVHVEAGAIKYAVAELVHAGDEFKYLGPNTRPVHEFNPFNDRGRLVGGYVVAELPDGSVIITHMSLEQIHKIRERSPSWGTGKNSPWNTDHDEMAKKTLIRRAKKSWPKSSYSERVRTVDQVMDESNPIALEAAPEAETPERADMLLKIRAALEIVDKTEDGFITYLQRIFRRELKSLEGMTSIEMRRALVGLGQLVDQKNSGEK